MHYFIIAGEASGDLHASHLIEAIKKADNKAVITFLGGDKMAQASGEKPIVHYRDMAYMGFSEVLRNLDKISANLRTAREALKMAKPDCLILVDYPSFNLKVASTAAKEKIPVYYYISPKIWAWKKWRINDIRRLVRRMFAILPFEPAFYRANNFDATYVGNPSVAEIDARLAQADSREAFLSKYSLRDRPLVALMPGSRRGEIRNNLAVMNLAVSRFPQYRGVIIAAPGVSDDIDRANGAGNLPILRPSEAAEVLAHCRAALITSGTATLECALCGVPQVVCYRANGAKISYDIMKRILSVEHVSLPNLIAGRTIIPEQLVHQCTPDLVAEQLGPLLKIDSPQREAQIKGYADMRARLGNEDAAANTAREIIKDLKEISTKAQS